MLLLESLDLHIYTDAEALLPLLQRRCRVLDLADGTYPISVKTQSPSHDSRKH